MRFSVHIAALFLTLIQSVGLCACRLDNSHLFCFADHSIGTSCSTSNSDKPVDSNCDAQQQQLKQVRAEQEKPVDLSVVPVLIPGLNFVPADTAPSVRLSDSTAPPSLVGCTVSLPLLN